MRGSISTDETVAEEHRQHVPAPTSLRRRDEELPHVLELEERSEETPVPDQRIEGREECNGRRRLGRTLQESDLVPEHEPLRAHVLDVDGYELAVGDQLLTQRRSPRIPRHPRIRLRRAEAAEDVPTPSDTEEAVGAISREELVAELLLDGNITCEELGR